MVVLASLGLECTLVVPISSQGLQEKCSRTTRLRAPKKKKTERSSFFCPSQSLLLCRCLPLVGDSTSPVSSTAVAGLRLRTPERNRDVSLFLVISIVLCPVRRSWRSAEPTFMLASRTIWFREQLKMSEMKILLIYLIWSHCQNCLSLRIVMIYFFRITILSRR